MRSGYSDDLDQPDLAMWRGRVASSIRGKRGQQLLRNLLKALDEMSEKRLIRNELTSGAGVCLLGAGGRSMGIADIDWIDPDDHATLADRFDVAECLIQEIENENDDSFLGSRETPEQRYERMRKWLLENIVGTEAQSA
jgi:hypothetical protein